MVDKSTSTAAPAPATAPSVPRPPAPTSGRRTYAASVIDRTGRAAALMRRAWRGGRVRRAAGLALAVTALAALAAALIVAAAPHARAPDVAGLPAGARRAGGGSSPWQARSSSRQGTAQARGGHGSSGGAAVVANTRYAPPAFTVSHVDLNVSLSRLEQPGKARADTTAVLHVPACPKRAPGGGKAGGCGALELNARLLQVVEVAIDGKRLPPSAFTRDKEDGGRLLTIKGEHLPAARPFKLLTRSVVTPDVDSAWQGGLFVTGGVWATRFEPFGFSRVSPFPDEPDVQPTWVVRIEADQQQAPVLLSNGRLVRSGKLPGARHYATWQDDRPKPSYQVSIHAGELAEAKGSFTSCLSGKTVALKIFMPPALIKQVDYTMAVQLAAMAWHEAAWGVPYYADSYTLIGVPGLTGEAMEASQTGAFNANMLAATPELDSDREADEILRLVAHEYFHSLAGNRVTVRSWHELTLKEGLTTFFEQAFAADMDTAETLLLAPGAGGAAAARARFPPLTCKAAPAQAAITLEAARQAAAGMPGSPQLLRLVASIGACRSGRNRGCAAEAAAAGSHWRRAVEGLAMRRQQFPEDDGSYAHSIRTNDDSHLWTIYSDTVYRKGAEVVRMYRTLLGPEAFHKGVYNWLTQFVGKAGTVEDFFNTMAATRPGALPAQFMRWYDQPGTPWVSVAPTYDAARKTLTLALEQENPKGAKGVARGPLLIPLKVGLLGPDGRDLPLRLRGGGAAAPAASSVGPGGAQSLVLPLTGWKQSFVFEGVPHRPVVSLPRDFSAPVRVWVDGQSAANLSYIAQHDSNAYMRFEAVYRLINSKSIMSLYWTADEAGASAADAAGRAALAKLWAKDGGVQGVPKEAIQALKAVLPSPDVPSGVKAAMLRLPSMLDMMNAVEDPKTALLYTTRAHVGRVLAQQLREQLLGLVRSSDAAVAALSTQGFNAPAINARGAANGALRLLAYDWSPTLEQQLEKRFYAASAMATRLTALQLLVTFGSQRAATAALAHFKATYAARSPAAMLEWLKLQGAAERPDSVAGLRSLVLGGGLDLRNSEQVRTVLEAFAAGPIHLDASGGGYKLFVDAILKVDAVSPDTASQLLLNLADFRELARDQTRLVHQQLKRLNKAQLSKGTQELLDWILEGSRSGDA